MPFTKIAAAGIGSTGTVTLENVVVTGSLNAASLTGAASTANVRTNSLTVSGVSTLGNTVVGGGTTQLVVNGSARITGILTIGTSSVTLDGTNNQVNVGTGVTIHHTNGVQVGGNTVHSTGLTVNSLNVSGVSTFSNGIIVAAGSTAAPSITPSGDSNTGIFFPAPDTVAVSYGGTEVLRASNGNIGIGTNNVNNIINIQNSSSLNEIQFRGSSYTNVYSNTDSGFDIGINNPSSTASFNILTANSSKFTVDSSGRVLKPLVPAFLAYHQASDLTYTPGQTLSYPFTLYNIGNHYNTSTSTFTAPIAGRYLFSINAQGDYSASFVGIPRAYWKINGSNVANAIHLRGPDSFDQGLEQRSQTVIFSLSANDAVNMVVGENRWDIFGANFFMGYLIG